MTIQQLFASMHAVSISHDMHVVLTKAYMLAEIDSATQAASEHLATDPNYFMGRVFPRDRARFKWRAHEVQMWRLDVEQPLWLGADGAIYQGYDIDVWDDGEFPDYLLPADLENWDVLDTKQVLVATQAIAGR